MILKLAFALSISAASLPAPESPANLVQVEYILPAARVVQYPVQTELTVLSQTPMSPEAQNAFDTEFKNAPYFGAFALSKDGGWGYATAANTISAARDIAIQQCLGANTTQCRVVAEIKPVGFVPLGAGDISIAPEALGHYLNPETNVVPFAMAVSEDGAYSKVWAATTQDEANASALSDCETYRITDLPNLADYPCVLLPPAPKK